ncbi:helix-turn-helix transcriptional regulator [Desulfoscipio gibsoniae]|uniref:DNA-binding protein, excisionase family n=1 Tax=Desulfoscipio gibsoniae DSM 7213 TaxID=767817 RepID=R4KMY6_9FIRM|nr:helix-turn-helix transcriptional regulator [Desulfoscipio gibsoniae]AGL01925.1 DNA-binding protein, excisionase family [Desulfoscipio gibsoniae DSM 7213]
MKAEEISLTPQEVADILKITKNTVYELIKRGELPAYRVGRKIRVDLQDVEAYKRHGKNIEITPDPGIASCRTLPLNPRGYRPEETVSYQQGLVICGQDVILDILTRHLERHPNGVHAFRHYVGSFTGLLALYQGKAHMAAIHLWDGDTGIYNIPFVRRLLPGIPAIIVHLAYRMQGFYLAKDNPKNIKEWKDLTRPDVCFINREKGCGTRVLLDEQLRRLGLDRRLITGYEKEELSHLGVASTVARGEADVGLGNEKAGLQVRGLEFLPLHKERYELVIKKEDMEKPHTHAVIEILQSEAFKKEVQGLGDYDLTETGRIVAEV